MNNDSFCILPSGAVIASSIVKCKHLHIPPLPFQRASESIIDRPNMSSLRKLIYPRDAWCAALHAGFEMHWLQEPNTGSRPR